MAIEAVEMETKDVSNLVNTEPKISFLQKVGYGLGDSGANFAWSFVSSFALIYFTDTVGVSVAVLGTLMLLSRLLDGVSDVLMGIVIDRTKNKMGKTRFWQFVGSFPLAISVFLLFNVPSAFSTTGKYAYIFIIYTLLGAVFYTMSNVAYGAMVAYVTKSKEVQVSLYSFRFMFSTIAGIVISSATMKTVELFGGGQTGWFWVSLIYAVLCLILLNMPVIALRELPESELAVKDQKKEGSKEQVGIVETFIVMGKNRFVMYSLFRGIVLAMGPGILGAVGIYYAKYILDNSSLLGLLFAAMGLSMMLILPFMSWISKKMSLRMIGMISTIAGMLGGILMLVSGGNLILLLLGLGIFGISLGPISAIGGAFKAEMSEYSILKHGKNITGAIFSANSMVTKIGTGLAIAITGLILEWGGYDGKATEQSESALMTINYLYTSPIFIVSIIALVLFALTTVERENVKLRTAKKK